MSLKKLADLAKKFQIKLAQSPRPAGINPIDNDTPFGKSVLRPNHPNNPYGVDAPFGGTAGDPLKDFSYPATPAKAVAPNAPASPSAAAMPSQVSQALDKVAPVLKGNLFLTVDGKDVNARFNNILDFNANQIKALLMKAFPGYTINVIGEQNPRWIANYK